MKKHIKILFVVLLIFIVRCSKPTSPEEAVSSIDFTLDGENYHYVNGMNIEPVNMKDACMVHYPSGYVEGYGQQYHLLGFENVVSDRQEMENGISFGMWQEDNWKWAIAIIDKENGISETDNMLLSTFPFDTTVVNGKRLTGKVNGEFEITSGSASGKIIKNISFSLIRVNIEK